MVATDTRRGRLSKRLVDAVTPPLVGEARVWDAEIRGLCLRTYASGRKVYAVKYRVGAQQRWFTIGEHGSPWTAEEAREEAKRVLRRAADGHDAQTEKVSRRADLTVAELIDAYVVDGPKAKPNKRASTWAHDRSNLDRHIRPLLGRRMAKDIRQSDVGRAMKAITVGETQAQFKTKARGVARITGGPGAAARALSTMGAMYSWAKKEGLVAEIPTVDVALPRSAGRETFLTLTQARGLLSTIAALDERRAIPSHHAAIFSLLLLTGARKSEISQLRWSEVDLAAGRILLPPERSKTGGKTGSRRISLSAAALAVISGQPRTSTFVFPSSVDPAKATVGLFKNWKKVRVAAGHPDLRIHDLRHSYASMAIEGGASLPVIGKALGHSGSRVTERYAHLTDNPVDRLSAAIGEALVAPGLLDAAE